MFKGRTEEIVPDSEEECVWNVKRRTRKNQSIIDVIEISSDESEDDVILGASTTPGAKLLDQLSGRSKYEDISPRKCQILNSTGHITSLKATGTGSSSEVRARSNKSSFVLNDADVIDISDISDSNLTSTKSTVRGLNTLLGAATSISSPMNVRAEDSNDDSILTLDEPSGARRPLYVDGSPVASRPRRKKSKLQTTISEGVISTPAQSWFLDDVCNNGSPAQKTPSKKQTPRQTNKVHITEEQLRLEAYAQQVFTELNKSVFEDKLPKSTTLNWNKRLLSTAGRAKWHRSKEGVQTTEIELAAKILDCEERIRNTLSHEMCHLATWIIDADPKETHGKLWKTWTAKVMLKRPEITISTRHDYEISYPYQWKCELCSKIYGRFSKSIRPDECVCGSCKEGKLVPLFATRQRAPKTPKTSKMAAIKANDSPCSITPVPKTTAPGLKFCALSDSDSDIEILVNAMGSTTIVD